MLSVIQQKFDKDSFKNVFLTLLEPSVINDYNIGYYGLGYRLKDIKNQNEAFLGACEGGYLDLVKFILEKNNDWYFDFTRGFVNSCFSKNFELIDFLLSRLEDCDWTQILTVCSYSNHPEVIEYILNKVDITKVTWWIVLRASCSNNSKVLDLTLKKALILSPDDWEVIVSSASLNFENFKFLLNRIEDEKINTTIDWSDCFFRICWKGNIEALKYMFEKQRELNFEVNWNNCFNYICKTCKVDSLKFFLEKSRDVGIRFDYNIGFMSAVCYGNLEVIKYLLAIDNGSINILSYFLYSIRDYNCFVFIKELCEAEESVNNIDWNQVFIKACFYNYKTVKVVDATKITQWNKGFLVACEKSELKTLLYIMENCSLLDFDQGLINACRTSNYDNIKLLLKYVKSEYIINEAFLTLSHSTFSERVFYLFSEYTFIDFQEALFNFCRKGNLTGFLYLVEWCKKHSFSIRYKDLFLPSCHGGDLNILRLLFKDGNVSEFDLNKGLSEACNLMLKKVFHFLVKKGAETCECGRAITEH